MKTCLTLICVSVAMNLLHAQNPTAIAQKNPCARNEKNKQWMMDSLNLSSDQKTKINTLYANSCKRIDSLKMANGSISQADREKVKQIQTDTRKQVSAVLNREQKEKLKQHYKTHKNNMHHEKNKHGNKQQKGKMVRSYVLDSLNLTNDQRTLITSVYQKSDEQIATAKRSLKDNKDSMTTALKQIHKNENQSVASILTEPQKQMLKNKFGKHEKADPGKVAQKMTDRMSSELSLSNDQKTKIYALNKNFIEQKEALRTKYAPNKSDDNFKKEQKQLNQNYKKELGTVLTPEQQKKLDEIKKDRHKNSPDKQ